MVLQLGIEDLLTHVQRHMNLYGKPLPHHTVRSTFAEMCGAVAEVHARGFLHGDIKLENFIFVAPGSVRLIDFEFASWVGIPASRRGREAVGTLGWVAPEVIASAPRQYGIEAD